MSMQEYNTVARLPLTQIADPTVRAQIIQFAARIATPRMGAALVAAMRRAC